MAGYGYMRLLGRLVQNLVSRVGEDLADCVAVCRRGLVYKIRSFRSRYDDVGPGGPPDFQLQPEQLASLLVSVQNKPWFCQLDRKAAQDLVHNGGPGCFVVRPSASTRSLTLTLWFHHRPYNILIRQREDGLLALGSKKEQEMTFRSVDEMVRHYETEPLILYSGGELTGRTRLRAPPPGLVGGRASASASSDGLRRSSDGSEQSRRSSSACLRASGKSETPFASTKSALFTSDGDSFGKCKPPCTTKKSAIFISNEESSGKCEARSKTTSRTSAIYTADEDSSGKREARSTPSTRSAIHTSHEESPIVTQGQDSQRKYLGSNMENTRMPANTSEEDSSWKCENRFSTTSKSPIYSLDEDSSKVQEQVKRKYSGSSNKNTKVSPIYNTEEDISKTWGEERQTKYSESIANTEREKAFVVHERNFMHKCIHPTILKSKSSRSEKLSAPGKAVPLNLSVANPNYDSTCL